MFRGKFCAGLLQLHSQGKLQFHGQLQPLQDSSAFRTLLRQLGSGRWVVFAKGSVVGPDGVLEYLGRYTHRVALTDGRLRAIDPSARTVTFAYKDYADGDRIKTMTLTGGEFIRRWLLHVLPPAFTKIRHYGPPSGFPTSQEDPVSGVLNAARWPSDPFFASQRSARTRKNLKNLRRHLIDSQALAEAAEKIARPDGKNAFLDSI